MSVVSVIYRPRLYGNELFHVPSSVSSSDLHFIVLSALGETNGTTLVGLNKFILFNF